MSETPEALPARLFPIQRERGAKAHPLLIPWSVAEMAYSVYSAEYGRGQSLERMAERGGFCPSEMDQFYPAWREASSEVASLRAALATADRALAAPPVVSPRENRDELTAVRLTSGSHALRLREWARLLTEHGNDISHWGNRQFVASEMERIAKTLDELGRGFYYRAPGASQAQESEK